MNEQTERFKHIGDFVMKLHNEACHFQSVERSGKATNSEVRRWFKQSAIHVNGNAAKFDDPVPEDFDSLVLFPNSVKNKMERDENGNETGRCLKRARRTTLW